MAKQTTFAMVKPEEAGNMVELSTGSVCKVDVVSTAE